MNRKQRKRKSTQLVTIYFIPHYPTSGFTLEEPAGDIRTTTLHILAYSEKQALYLARHNHWKTEHSTTGIVERYGYYQGVWRWKHWTE